MQVHLLPRTNAKLSAIRPLRVAAAALSLTVGARLFCRRSITMEIEMTFYLGTKPYRSIIETLEQLFLLIGPRDLADVLREIEPCAVTGEVTGDQIVGPLGEFGDIWPESIHSEGEIECIQIDSFEGMTFSEMRNLVKAIRIARTEAKAKSAALQIIPRGNMTLEQICQLAKPKVTAKIIQFPQPNDRHGD
jgi:hypothetical protein